MRTVKIMSLSLPPEMAEEIRKFAASEHRTVSELMRESFRQYISSRGPRVARKEAPKNREVRKVLKKKKLVSKKLRQARAH
jgi:Arc/MetJ-type ribon-helix-helix transcriptional regulator